MTENKRTITLSPDELVELTGYRRSLKQIEELHRRGFHRAAISRSGGVVLERAHYEAVCRGVIERQRPQIKRPQLSNR